MLSSGWSIGALVRNSRDHNSNATEASNQRYNQTKAEVKKELETQLGLSIDQITKLTDLQIGTLALRFPKCIGALLKIKQEGKLEEFLTYPSSGMDKAIFNIDQFPAKDLFEIAEVFTPENVRKLAIEKYKLSASVVNQFPQEILNESLVRILEEKLIPISHIHLLANDKMKSYLPKLISPAAVLALRSALRDEKPTNQNLAWYDDEGLLILLIRLKLITPSDLDNITQMSASVKKAIFCHYNILRALKENLLTIGECQEFIKEELAPENLRYLLSSIKGEPTPENLRYLLSSENFLLGLREKLFTLSDFVGIPAFRLQALNDYRFNLLREKITNANMSPAEAIDCFSPDQILVFFFFRKSYITLNEWETLNNTLKESWEWPLDREVKTKKYLDRRINEIWKSRTIMTYLKGPDKTFLLKDILVSTLPIKTFELLVSEEALKAYSEGLFKLEDLEKMGSSRPTDFTLDDTIYVEFKGYECREVLLSKKGIQALRDGKQPLIEIAHCFKAPFVRSALQTAGIIQQDELKGLSQFDIDAILYNKNIYRGCIEHLFSVNELNQLYQKFKDSYSFNYYCIVNHSSFLIIAHAKLLDILIETHDPRSFLDFIKTTSEEQLQQLKKGLAAGLLINDIVYLPADLRSIILTDEFFVLINLNNQCTQKSSFYALANSLKNLTLDQKNKMVQMLKEKLISLDAFMKLTPSQIQTLSTKYMLLIQRDGAIDQKSKMVQMLKEKLISLDEFMKLTPAQIQTLNTSSTKYMLLIQRDLFRDIELSKILEAPEMKEILGDPPVIEVQKKGRFQVMARPLSREICIDPPLKPVLNVSQHKLFTSTSTPSTSDQIDIESKFDSASYSTQNTFKPKSPSRSNKKPTDIELITFSAKNKLG